MTNELEEFENKLSKGVRRCVCTEERYCNTCREHDQLKKVEVKK